jgi:hypothetical protein
MSKYLRIFHLLLILKIIRNFNSNSNLSKFEDDVDIDYDYNRFSFQNKISNNYLTNLADITDNNESLPLASIMDRNLTINNNYSNCFLFDIKNWVQYDLYPIARKSNSDYDYNITIISDNDTFTIFYDFCNFTIYECRGQHSFVTAKYDLTNSTNSVCTAFTSSSIKQWRYNIYPKDSMEKKYLALKMETGQKCRDDFNFSTTFNFICDENMPEDKYVIDKERIQNYYEQFRIGSQNSPWNRVLCERALFFISKVACPQKKLYPLWKFYLANDYTFGLFFILTGMYLLFFGLINEKITNFLIGQIFAMYTFYIILIFVSFDFAFLHFLWCVMFFQVFIGILASMIMYRSEKFKFLILSFTTGISIASLNFYLLISKLDMQPIILFFLNLLMFLVLSIMTLLLILSEKSRIIFASSISGAFIIIRVRKFIIKLYM